MKTKKVILWDMVFGWCVYALGMLMMLARIFAPAPQFIGW